MPKKTSYKSKPEFYETLAPSMAFSPAIESRNVSEATPLWVYPAWIGGSIILGVLIGFAVKDLNQSAIVSVSPGNVARITHMDFDRIATGQKLVLVQNQILQGNSAAIQAQSTGLQNGKTSSDYQTSFNGYGLQGSVGTAASH